VLGHSKSKPASRPRCDSTRRASSQAFAANLMRAKAVVARRSSTVQEGRRGKRSGGGNFEFGGRLPGIVDSCSACAKLLSEPQRLIFLNGRACPVPRPFPPPPFEHRSPVAPSTSPSRSPLVRVVRDLLDRAPLEVGADAARGPDRVAVRRRAAAQERVEGAVARHRVERGALPADLLERPPVGVVPERVEAEAA